MVEHGIDWDDDTDRQPGDGRVYFISGHLDLTQAEFEEHYIPKLSAAINTGHASSLVTLGVPTTWRTSTSECLEEM